MAVSNVLNRGSDFSSIGISLLGNFDLKGCSSIQYKVVQEKANNYGLGSEPVSRSRGAKQYEGSITLADYEIRAILEASDEVSSLVDIKPFNITVTHTDDNGGVVSDVLEQCEFLEDNFSAGVGDTDIQLELPLIIGNIQKSE